MPSHPETRIPNSESQVPTDERLAALLSNANAIRAITQAVEGTLGPKGLDCLLVDRSGGVTITNDGSTILDRVDISHPAARMLIHAAKAQEEAVGDGTTTATLLAGALIQEGVNAVSRGVPVTKVIEGIRAGVACARERLEKAVAVLSGPDDPLLFRVALVAGRGHEDVADLAVRAARILGRDRLGDPAFKLADWVVATEGADNQVVPGVVMAKSRLSRQMPREVQASSGEALAILVLDDALEPDEIAEEALATEAGFRLWQENQKALAEVLRRVVACADSGPGLRVRAVFASRGIGDLAEEILTEAGVLAVRRVTSRDLVRLAEHTGARAIKRASLGRAPEELEGLVGRARRVVEDERAGILRVEGGAGVPTATILVGAATAEVREERERIAKDAASAVQAALSGGVLPGGGSIELAAARAVEVLRDGMSGMATYGVDCVIAALRRPLAQIVANAGFNPLEKIGDVIAAQVREDNPRLAIDCDTGEIADMTGRGIVDAAPVKLRALDTAGEVAEAILRINTIIRMKQSAVSE